MCVTRRPSRNTERAHATNENVTSGDVATLSRNAANRSEMSMRKLTGATRRASSVNCAVHGLRDSPQGRDARGTRPHHCDRLR